MNDRTKTVYQKAAARELLVKERRKAISDRLTRLAAVTSPEALTGDDLRIWKLFEAVNEPKKLKAAADKKRIRFQLGQRDRFMAGIYHSGRYLAQMEKIFRDERLPIELTRLPFVESSFDIHARSKVGASGIWQFMRRSARPYLKVNRNVDERNDPLKATRASARLLRQNYEMLGSWPLALTAYNHGSTGMRKIVNRLRTRDIVHIVESYQSRTFGFASENFYACFLAALEVEREAGHIFTDPRWGPAMEEIEVRLSRPMSYPLLVEIFSGDRERTDLANPQLTQRVRQNNALVPPGSYVRVPRVRIVPLQNYQAGRLSADQLVIALKEAPNQLAPPKALPASSATEPNADGAAPRPLND